ncbi:MAG: hypothetical protein KC910_25630 [Candidatus Eremiobacteraeota bacterium]|nr:hypothetical protein [Candidatus Eremiobacteraeota bacterium]
MLWGCDTVSTGTAAPAPNLPNPVPVSQTFPAFDPTNSVIPLPNDIARNPQTGFNQFTSAADPNGTTEPFASMNSLQGFSTSGSLIIPFVGPVVPASVTNDTLPVFNTTTGQKATMTYQVLTTATGSTVFATPVVPLNPGTRYLVVVTSGVISASSGGPVISNSTTNFTKLTTPLVSGNTILNLQLAAQVASGALTLAQVQSLEGLRAGLQPVWSGAEQLVGTTRANIPMAFAFTTQPLFVDLPAARAQAVTDNRPLVNALGTAPLAGTGAAQTVDQFYMNTPGLSAAIPHAAIARIFTGTVTGRNYITNPITGPWPSPIGTGTDRPIPFFACLPAGAGPFPVVIFQHGITRNKNDIFATANGYCGQGFAVIAIDLELHGALRADMTGPDGTGTNPFINLAVLRMTRDNIRQSAVHLFYVTQAIASGQTNLDATAGPEFVPVPNARPFFVGTSMGGIVGTVAMAVENNLVRGVLNVAGGRLVATVLASPTFKPQIIAGLAQAGLIENTPDFFKFLLIAQTVVDDADPINYAPHVLTGDLAGNTPASILLQECIGDVVVPNSSTEDLARSFATAPVNPAFSQVAAINPVAGVPQVAINFVGPALFQIANAAHGAILDPGQGPTTQIITQIINFLGTNTTVNPGFPRVDNAATPVFDPSQYDNAIYGP